MTNNNTLGCIFQNITVLGGSSLFKVYISACFRTHICTCREKAEVVKLNVYSAVNLTRNFSQWQAV